MCQIALETGVGRWMESVLELVSPEKAEGFQLISRNSQNGLPEHYHRCVRRGNATLHLNFYGLTRSDLGKLVNFRTVTEAWKSTNRKERMSIFTKCPESPCRGSSYASEERRPTAIIKSRARRCGFVSRRVALTRKKWPKPPDPIC